MQDPFSEPSLLPNKDIFVLNIFNNSVLTFF